MEELGSCQVSQNMFCIALTDEYWWIVHKKRSAVKIAGAELVFKREVVSISEVEVVASIFSSPVHDQILLSPT